MPSARAASRTGVRLTDNRSAGRPVYETLAFGQLMQESMELRVNYLLVTDEHEFADVEYSSDEEIEPHGLASPTGHAVCVSPPVSPSERVRDPRDAGHAATRARQHATLDGCDGTQFRVHEQCRLAVSAHG